MHMCADTVYDDVQVFLHYSVLGDDEKPLYSTRADQGGAGIPEPFVLGKDGRLPRGVHLAVLGALFYGRTRWACAWCSLRARCLISNITGHRSATGMRRNERSLFTINPEYAFQHQDFSGTVPRGVDPSQSVVLDVQVRLLGLVVWQVHAPRLLIGLHVDDTCMWSGVQLTHWYPRQGVRVLGPRSDIYKRRLEDGEGWETPRTPFEVRPWAGALTITDETHAARSVHDV